MVAQGPTSVWRGAALAAALALAACAPERGEDPVGAGVLLIAVDGLRADHLSCLGYDRPTTPALDRLAAEGVLFAQAFTPAPELLPANAALLTGCDPNLARRYLADEVAAAVERRWWVPAELPQLAVEMLASGRATAAFVDHPELAPAYGFGTGFQEYVGSEPGTPWNERVGAPVLSAYLLQWLRSVDRDEPWFAFLHLHDLERAWSRPDPQWDAYFVPRAELSEVAPVGNTDATFFALPRSRWRGGSRTIGEYEAVYDGHLRRLDEELQRLLGSLQVAGRLEDTTVVVVGTHGVQFGEDALYLRAGRYSMADLHVPLILRPARGVGSGAGRRVDAVTSLVDVAPTLLELAGIARPRGMHGISLAGHLRTTGAESVPTRALAFASCGIQGGHVAIGERHCYEVLFPGEVAERALRRSWFGDMLAHDDVRTVRFYDRLAEPFPPAWGGLEPNELAAEMADALARWVANVESARAVVQRAPLAQRDASDVGRLQELGYLGDAF